MQPGQSVLLVLNLTARPDVEDLMRVMAADNPADGADTVTRWRVMAAADTVARLEVAWLEPVYTELAVVLDADDHREALTAAVADGRIALTATDPAGSLDAEFPLVAVSTDGASLTSLTQQAALSCRR
ncbi:hypothetical protein AB0442_29595 [Kitasatospora sp. NPDC085895]|uniref:hypothetical protein n=1 Tax=Kitasatospora sp. NPDC085895 TaxID=3155057 RepID=UPI003450B07E